MIDAKDEAHAFKIMLDENTERKPFTDPEMAALIKQFDEMMREKHGEQPQGKHRSSFAANDDGWSQDRTAESLGVSQPVI